MEKRPAAVRYEGVAQQPCDPELPRSSSLEVRTSGEKCELGEENSLKTPGDFSYWERRYGRKLSELEKNNIATRLGGFFQLLAEMKAEQGARNGRTTKN